MAIGDHLSDVKTLWGVAGCANTSKCLFASAEKGVDIEGKTIDLNSESEMTKILKFSQFGSIPILKDVDFYVYGVGAILSYLDDKGFGNSLVPRNGVARALQYQWIHVANDFFAPAIEKIKDASASESETATIKKILTALDQQLATKPQRGDYIVGDFTLADIHWAPYIHTCCLYGHESLIDALPNVKKWWSNMKIRKSMSKENYVAYMVLPSLEEIQNNRLRSVHINA